MLIETDRTVKLNICAFSRKGYDFVGWATSQNGEKVYSDGQNYTMGVNSEYVLYAVWKIKTYTIEYNLNNGTAPSNKTSYTVETESFTLENPSRDGYTFIGWSGTDIADKSSAVTIEKGSIGNKSFTANWQANTNVLHFNANGGDGDMDNMSIKTDETKTLTANTFTRKGYQFKGWANTTNGAIAYLDLSSYKMGTAPVYTLYAVWEANRNRLIFNGNGATSGGMDEMSIKTDESTSLTDCGFAKIGYSFKGWATESNGSVKYTNKATYIMGAESSYTLYAVWQINQYTITLELNGGTASKNSITQDYNSVVDSPVATRSGYGFVEWYADSDFATVYNFSTMPAEDITVYAKWQLDTTYTGEIGIRNIQELQAINGYLSGKFYLENDIVANGFDFTPLGSRENPFAGAFNGKDKIINGLYILEKTESSAYIGLFGKSNGKVYNTHILNAFYQMPNATNGSVGGICGWSSGIIENCSWNGLITISSGRCGGIVGDGTATISQCVASGTINTNYVLAGVGGIAGYARTIENCYVDMKIYNLKLCDTTAPTNHIGGLIARESNIINSFVSKSTTYYLRYHNYNVFSTSESVSRLCYKGTITNSFRVSNSSGNNIISPENVKSRAIMTSKYGWSTDIWCFGYDYPVLYGNDYVKVNYSGIDGLNNDNNPDGYKKNSDGFVLSSIIKGGYTFGGWYSDSSYTTKVEKVVNITEPMTLYAKWIPKNYTLTLNTVGGEISKNTATVTYDSNYTLEVPTRLGYTFLGWYDGTGNSAVAYTDETGKSLGKWTTLNNDLILYAHWQIITYAITYDYNGGVTDAILPTTYTVVDEVVIDTLINIKKIGYTFVGWSNGGIIFKGTVGNKNFKAEYSADVKLSDDGTIVIGLNNETENLVILSNYNGINVTAVGNEAFKNCSNLKSVTLPESIASIGSYAFHNCKELKSINIPNSVKSIGVSTFLSCSSLEKIIIPNNVNSIGAFAFASCSNLTTVVLGDSLKTIETSVFSGCTQLIAITIGNKIENIENGAFNKCEKLSSITLSASVKFINQDAFEYCESLSQITYIGTITEWKAIRKNDYWRRYSKITKVICSDGAIALDS